MLRFIWIGTDPFDASEAHQGETPAAGRLMLVERGGGVPFGTKAYNAQLAGASAVLIVNEENGRSVRDFMVWCSSSDRCAVLRCVGGTPQ